jgi:hypothetical protein
MKLAIDRDTNEQAQAPGELREGTAAKGPLSRLSLASLSKSEHPGSMSKQNRVGGGDDPALWSGGRHEKNEERMAAQKNPRLGLM